LAITLGINFFGPNVPERLSDVNEQSESKDRLMANDQPEPESQTESFISSGPAKTRLGENLQEKVAEVLVLMETEAQPDDEAISDVSQEFEVPSNDGPRVASPNADTMVLLNLDAGEDLPLEQLAEFDAVKKRDPRWMLGAVLSPLYSYRDADLQAMSGGTEYESGLVSYAGGINVSYRGNSRLAIETGIHFNKMGISIGAPGIQLFGNSFVFAPMREASNSPEIIAITNSVGNIVTESGQIIVNGYKLNAEYGADAISNSDVADFSQVAEQGIEQHLDYLELPFNVRYTVIDRTFELQLVGGMSTNFLVNNYVTMETASGNAEIGYLTNIRSVNYSGNAGIGMIYHLHDKFSLLLEPRFRYFLNSVNDASLPTTRPYALGIYMGINYTF